MKCFHFHRSPQEGGGAPTSGHKFLLKWSVPLSFVEVLEFGSSEEIGDAGRFPTPHSGEKVVINAKPSRFHSVLHAMPVGKRPGLKMHTLTD